MIEQGEVVGLILHGIILFFHPPSPNKWPCFGINGPNISFLVFFKHTQCRNRFFLVILFQVLLGKVAT